MFGRQQLHPISNRIRSHGHRITTHSHSQRPHRHRHAGEELGHRLLDVRRRSLSAAPRFFTFLPHASIKRGAKKSKQRLNSHTTEIGIPTAEPLLSCTRLREFQKHKRAPTSALWKFSTTLVKDHVRNKLAKLRLPSHCFFIVSTICPATI